MALYVGLDSSTQSLSAIVIEASDSRREVVWETSLNFDEALPRYGTRHGVLPRPDPAVAVSSPDVVAASTIMHPRGLSGSQKTTAWWRSTAEIASRAVGRSRSSAAAVAPKA